jgi:hypothetical protein
MLVQKILDEIKELTPQDGFNIVLHDDFAPWGENLTLIKHVNTREEAEIIQQEYEEMNRNGLVYANAVYIYDKNTLQGFHEKLKSVNIA